MPIPSEILKKALQMARLGASPEERESFERSCHDLLDYAVSHPLAGDSENALKQDEKHLEHTDITKDSRD